MSQIISSRVRRRSSPLATFKSDILPAAVYFSRALTLASLAAPVSISRSQHFGAGLGRTFPVAAAFSWSPHGGSEGEAPRPRTPDSPPGLGVFWLPWSLLGAAAAAFSLELGADTRSDLPALPEPGDCGPRTQTEPSRKGQRCSQCPLASLTFPTEASNPQRWWFKSCGRTDPSPSRAARGKYGTFGNV